MSTAQTHRSTSSLDKQSKLESRKKLNKSTSFSQTVSTQGT